MAVTQYIGARYVPIFADPAEWTNTKQYEPLTIVLHEGNSFTSKQFVPVGVDIDNTDFWAETGNYNAQVEAYRQEVERFSDSIQELPFGFDTVAGMQGSDNLYEGAICHTNGFHSSGDGGAAWYVISDSGQANGMDVLECSDSLYAHLIVGNGYVTPEQFGAYGNGTNDDTSSIQQAIDVCGNVLLLSKVYIVKGVELKGATTISGLGNSTIKLASNLTNDDKITDATGHPFNGVPTLYSSYYSARTPNITLKNFVLDGNYQGQSVVNENSSGIYLNNVQDCIIEGVEVRNSNSHGIFIKEGLRCIISNCYVHDNGYGYTTGGSQKGDGIDLVFACMDCTISNCIVAHNSSIGIEFEGRFGGIIAENRRDKRCVANSCICSENGDHNYMIGWNDDSMLTNCISKSGSTNGLNVLGCKDCEVENFNSIGDAQSGIYVRPETYGADGVNARIRIKDATIINSRGITMESASEVTLSAVVQDTTRGEGAIKIDTCTEVDISAIIKDARSNVNNGMYVVNSSDVSIHDSKVKGVGRFGVFGENGAYVSIDNLRQEGGIRAFSYSGSAVSPVLNGVIEKDTSSNITATYGSFSAFHIYNNTVISST